MIASYDQHGREPEQIYLQTKTITGIAFVFAIYSIITGLLFLHFRNWDTVILKQVAGTLAYPLLLFGGVAFSFKYFRKTLWVLPIALLIFMGFPFGVSLMGRWSLVPVGLLGVGAMIWTIWRSESFKSFDILFKGLAVGMGLAIIYFFVVNGIGYATVFSDIAAYNGTIVPDPLYHSSIINMIAYFGTPSIGLDGIQPHFSHVASHRWVAYNLRVLGGNTILLLSLSQQLAFLPVLFFSITLVILSLSFTLPSVLGAVASTFITLWFSTFFGGDKFLFSESLTFSLPIFVAMVPIGRSWLVRSCQSERFIAIKPWEIALAFIAVVVCWAAKMSSGFILAVYIVACILVPKFLQDPKKFLLPTTAVIGFVCLGVIGFIKFGLNPAIVQIFPFHFARFYADELLWRSSLFFLALGLLLFLTTRSEKPIWYPLALVLIVTFLISQIPGEVLELGINARYFLQEASLVTLLFFTAALVDHQATRHSDNLLAYNNLRDHRWKYLIRWLMRGLLGLIIIHVSIAYGERILKFTLAELRLNPQQTIAQQELLNWCRSNHGKVGEIFLSALSSPLKAYGLLSDLQPKLLDIAKGQIRCLLLPARADIHLLNPQSKLLYIEKAASVMKNTAGKKVMLYIPPTFGEFWNDFRIGPYCWDRPLSLTAVIGLPLLNGVRSGLASCESIKSHGMADYGADSLNKLLSDTEICDRAKKLGFSYVIEVGEDRKYLHDCR